MNLNNIPDAPLPPGFGGRGGRSCGCLGFLGALLICFAILMTALAIFALASGVKDIAAHVCDPEKTEESEGTKSLKPQVVSIEVRGAISFAERGSRFWEERKDSADSIVDAIEESLKDSSVRGLLLTVNSPGGEITACDVIDQAVQKFKNSSSNRYVVVYMQELAASGGYYISAHADKIVITPTTLTGSIGVIMQTYQYGDALRKLGVSDVTFTSGPMKDMLNPMHSVSPEVSNVVHSVIGELYDRFVGVIADGRHMSVEKVKELADGRIYTAKQAVDAGLVDKIGYMDEVEKTFRELGLSEFEIMEYSEEKDFIENLKDIFSLTGGFSPKLELPKRGWRTGYYSPFYFER